MSRTPSTIASPPPMAGEHNQEVLTDLGFTGGDSETLNVTASSGRRDIKGPELPKGRGK